MRVVYGNVESHPVRNVEHRSKNREPETQNNVEPGTPNGEPNLKRNTNGEPRTPKSELPSSSEAP